MKIAIVTDAWRPQISGVVTTLLYTIRELKQKGHEVLSIHPGLFATVPCPTYPQIRLAAHPLQKARKLIGAFGPDAVHIVTEGPLGLAGRRHCVKTGRPFTTSFTTRFDEYIHLRFPVIPGEGVFRLLRWFHKPAKRVMLSSEPLKRELESRGFSNIVLWPRGVDADLFRIRRKNGLPGHRPIFMYVGRVAVEKNIEAFLNLSLPGSKYVVGDGPALPALKRKYPRAHFTGPKLGEELAAHYAAADVFVFPSRTDTFGIVMLEAMASGAPVAAYPVRGPVDVVRQGVTGFLDENLETACLNALTLSPDACRDFAKRFSWENSAEKFIRRLAT